jgi:hypothetical protein
MTQVWGPSIWKYLHTLAEKIGCQQLNKLQEADERRLVIQILNSIGICMPCIICRKHYMEWKQQRSLKRFENLGQENLKFQIKTWLYELHNKVNENNKKPIDLVGFNELSELYGEVNIRQALSLIPIQSAEMKILRSQSYLLFSIWQV